MSTKFNESSSKKRGLFGGNDFYEVKKRIKQEDEDQKSYGDGIAWFRGAVVGKGSFGCVFRVNLKNPKSRYNSYPPVMAVKSAEVSVSGSIQKEKEVMDNIGGCLDVIKCFGEEITNGDNGRMVYNLLLEYGSGGTLADLIKNSAGGNGLPELDVRRYARSILRGLRHVHDRGYVHCDLKPGNILLVSNSRDSGFDAKIGDFGLAKRANRKKKNASGFYWRGTPMYLSPEAVIYGVQEPPADIWALGCIVLEMLTGKPLWFSKKRDLCVDEILRRIGEDDESPCISSEISKEGRSFLKGCLSRKIMCRLTADMLLDHPFLEGLDEDDAIEVKDLHQEVLDINTITSSPVFSDDDDDDDNGDGDMWLSSYSDGSCYSWSEGDMDSMNSSNIQ